MPENYYYIDDDPKQQIDEIAKGLSIKGDQLIVRAFQPKKWEEIIEFIITEQGNFDGLLLDWGLTKKNEDGDNPNFTVEALAQQIRRQIIEGDKLKKDFPIVLCSAQYNFNRIYDQEMTSHDLFDIVYEKDRFNDCLSVVINELTEISRGFKFLQSSINFENIEASIQKVFQINQEIIDYRVFDHLQKLIKSKKPIHEIARFILTRVLQVSGLLIEKHTLGARLGFDIRNQSEKDIQKLFSVLSTTRYNGAFGNGWERWWMPLIYLWWEKEFDIVLTDFDAMTRVENLNRKIGLNLTPAVPPKFAKSFFYWTVCQDTLAPIAIEDGVLKNAAIDKAPWEEDMYFSIEAALEKDTSEIHPLERERLERLKITHTKTRRSL